MFSSLPAYQSPGTQVFNNLSGLRNMQLQQQQLEAYKKEMEMKNQLFPGQLKQQELANKLAELQVSGYPEQLQKQHLANKLAQMEIEQYVPKTKAETAYKNALVRKMNFQQENPLYGQPGIAGQLGAANIASPQDADIIRNSLMNTQDQRQAEAELNRKRAEGYTFNSMPMPNRQYLLAQAAGMGIEPNEAAARFNKGETVDQMAVSQGLDPNNKPDPIYPLTTAGQTQLKSRQASLAELNKMGKIISDWAGPYARRISGYSPAQVKDALLGKNKDQQAKFLAARMLAPEQQAIRIKAMGGNVGIEAIREMTDLSLMHGKIFESLVSPEIFKKANDYVEEAIFDSVNAANKAATKSIGSKMETSSNNKYSQSDIEHTAKKYGLTVDEVKRRIGI